MLSLLGFFTVLFSTKDNFAKCFLIFVYILFVGDINPTIIVTRYLRKNQRVYAMNIITVLIIDRVSSEYVILFDTVGWNPSLTKKIAQIS